jgi:hypothetical protein
MKRNSLQRLSSFLPKPKTRLAVQQLEARDVPAVFTVDPLAVPSGNTYNFIDEAIAAAALNSEADTINLTANDHVARNFGGLAIPVNDNISIVGAGKASTRILVGFQAADPINDFVFDAAPGSTLNLSDLTYNGSGANDNGFKYDSATGTVNNVAFIGFGNGFNPSGTVDGNALWVRAGGTLTVNNSEFTNSQGRSSIYASSFTGTTTLTVTNSVFTGNGAGSDRDNYGVEAVGNVKATISGSTFTNNLADSGGAGSAGIVASADTFDFPLVYNPEITVLRSTFTNNTVGVFVGQDDASDKSAALLAYNSFTGQTSAAIQSSPQLAAAGGLVNARFNWFGSASGPSGTNGVLAGSTGVNTSQFLRAPLGTPESAAVSNNARFVTSPNSTANGTLTPNGNNTNGTFAAPSTPTGKAYPLRNSAGALVAETGETRSAFVDLNGDGFNEIIVSSGTSELVTIYNGVGAVWMKSFSGLTGALTPAKFAGGVYVAGGDINGDGTRDLIVSQGAFDPRVVVYNGTTVLSSTPTRLVDFIDAFNRGSLAMGVTVAAGDFNGDGYDDIVTGAIQPLASTAINSNVRVFDGKSLIADAKAVPNMNPALALNRTSDSPTPNVDFFAYSFTTGVYVAAADVNGDGRAELVTGAARLGANLRAYSFTAGSLLSPQTTGTPTLAADFLVGPSGSGVRVAARDLNNDGYADILWTLGTGAPPVGVIDGKSLTLTGPASGIAPPAAPVGYTLITAAYTSASKGAFVA